MLKELERYLSNLRGNTKLDLPCEREIISELETHIEDRLEEIKDTGLSEEEATKRCIGLLGSTKLIARQIYEAHSQGSWRQALLASIPHLFFATVFTLKWWGIGWLPFMLSLALAIVFYGWGHEKPTWFFPWLGYSLLPVVIAGLLLLYLPTGWSWLTILLYAPLVLWLLCYVIIKNLKRDWLYSTLMLLPLPTIIGWFLAVKQESEFFWFNLEHLYDFAPWIGMSFLLLGVTAAIFIRLRQRSLKILALVTSGLLALIMVAFSSGKLSSLVLVILILLTLSSCLFPALMENRIRRNNQQVTT